MKVFGIGLPRTATTSLAIGFEQMGFRTQHVSSRPGFYDRYDAFTDTPVYANFKELDLQFPDSKFIYVDRDIDLWVDSFVRMFSQFIYRLTTPITFEQWQTYDAYMKVFGRLTLDKNHLKRSYIEHKRDVESYFSDKDNLLVIRITDKDAFERVKNFLGRPDAQGSFVQTNKGSQITAWNDRGKPEQKNNL